MPSSSPTALLLFPLEGNSMGWPPDPGLCLKLCERFCTLKAKLANPSFLTALWSVKKNHISLAQFYEFLSWAREDICLWKWKKGHVNDLSTGNLIWDPVNSETEKFHPNPQMFGATAEELSFASEEPPPHPFAVSPAAGRAQKTQVRRSTSNAAVRSNWPWLITTLDRVFARVLPKGTFVQKDYLVRLKTLI